MSLSFAPLRVDVSLVVSLHLLFVFGQAAEVRDEERKKKAAEDAAKAVAAARAERVRRALTP